MCYNESGIYAQNLHIRHHLRTNYDKSFLRAYLMFEEGANFHFGTHLLHLYSNFETLHDNLRDSQIC